MPAANENKRQIYNPAIFVFFTFFTAAMWDCALIAACFTFCDTAMMLVVYAVPTLAVSTAAWWKGLPETVCGALLLAGLAALPVQFSLWLFWRGWYVYRPIGLILLVLIFIVLYMQQQQLPVLVRWMFNVNGAAVAQNRELNHTSAKIVAVVAIVLLTNLTVATSRGMSASYNYSLTQYDLMDLQERSAKAHNATMNAIYTECMNTQTVLNKDVRECAGVLLNETALAAMLPAQKQQIYLSHRQKHQKLLEKLDETQLRLKSYERRLEDNPFLWGAFADPVGPIRDMLDIANGFANLTVVHRFVCVVLVVTLAISIVGWVVGYVVYRLASDNEDTQPGIWTKMTWWLSAFFVSCVCIWYTNPWDLRECVPDPVTHAFRPSCFLKTFVVTPEQLQAIVDASMHTEFIGAVDKAQREAMADSRRQMFGAAWAQFDSFDKARVNESGYVVGWYEDLRSLVMANLKKCTYEEADAALKAAKPADDDGKLASEKMSWFQRATTWFKGSGVPAVAVRAAIKAEL